MESEMRAQVIEHIRLLSAPSEQLAYEENVAIADVFSELIDGYLFEPKSTEYQSSFSSNELKDLAHLYGLLREASVLQTSNITELLKEQKWRSVVSLAKVIVERME